MDMKDTIISYFQELNPDVLIQAPSRINLINPLDAVEGDFWMPTVAINGAKNPLSAFCYIKEKQKRSTLKIFTLDSSKTGLDIKLEKEEELLKDIVKIKAKFKSDLRLVYGSIYRLHKTLSSFWDRYLSKEFEIGILTTIPRQSGLGGSASIIVALLYSLSVYFELFNNLNILKEGDYPINKDTIAEMATKVEDQDLNITAGYADRYAISRGGLSFCSYYGKLYHKDLGKEPLAVYDRIDKVYQIKKIPIIICFSGVYHESGGVHDKLRELYLSNETNILENYKKLSKIAWKSRFALMNQNWKSLGKYFKKNTKLMNIIMQEAGFKFGIGLANNILITLIEDHPNVYAAKLTGAGGGGCVFALVDPNKIEEVKSYWNDELNTIIRNKKRFIQKFPVYPPEISKELSHAEFFSVHIDTEGVRVLYQKN